MLSFSFCGKSFASLKGATPHGASSTHQGANGKKAPGKSRVKKSKHKKEARGQIGNYDRPIDCAAPKDVMSRED